MRRSVLVAGAPFLWKLHAPSCAGGGCSVSCATISRRGKKRTIPNWPRELEPG